MLTLSLVLLGPGQTEECTLVYAYIRMWGWEVLVKMKIPLPTRLSIYSLHWHGVTSFQECFSHYRMPLLAINLHVAIHI